MAIWRDIPGFEGRYQVSDRGDVYSIISAICLRQSVHSTGRLQVTLVKDGKRLTKKVHQLVTLAFLGPAPDGMVVCHENGLPTDNRLENLRYDTQKQNINEAVGHRSEVNRSKQACPKGHPYDKDNTYWYQNRRQCIICRTERNRVSNAKRRTIPKR